MSEAPVSLGVGASLPEAVALEEVRAATPPSDGDSTTPRARPVGRDALIYGVGTLMSRAASFIMLPIYTRMLSPAGYGLLQMLDMAVDVTSLLVSAGCVVGVMRFYFKADSPREKERVISTAFALQVGLNIVGSIILALFAIPVWKHGLSSAGEAWYVRIAALNFTLGALLVVPQLYMQILGRAGLFTAVSLAKLFIQLGLNIAFLVVIRLGPVGILLSTMVANAVTGLAATVWLFRRSPFRLSRSAARDLYRFGVPYQIATAGSFVLTFGDRFFLAPSRGLAAVGIYSFAYQFGFLLYSIGVGPYSQAWTPRRYEIMDRPRAERDAVYNVGAFYQTLIIVTTAVGIALFVHPTLRIMSRVEFVPAADLVPVILAAYVFQAWGNEAQFGINASEQTRYSTYAAWIAVVAVLALYALLIPPYGALGAALATLISFALRTVFTYVFAQRVWPIDYRWAPHLRVTAVAAVIVTASFLVRTPALGLEIAIMSGLLAVYVGATWTLALDGDRRTEFVRFMAERRRTIVTRLRRA